MVHGQIGTSQNCCSVHATSMLYLLLLLLQLLDNANSGFIPGRGCGTVTSITILEDARDLQEGATCVLINDQSGFAELKSMDPGEQM